MTVGRCVDHVVGAMSRLLHVRPARDNTVAHLAPYLDLAPEALFPEPPPIVRVHLQRTLLDRVIRSSTVTWRSSHEPICPRYAARHRGEYKANLTAWARWIRPDGRQRRTCLVYVHGWLEPGSWAEETTLFRKWAREIDADLAHLTLPFHGARKPRSALFSGEFFWTADLVRSMEGVRQAVCDARAFVRWLRDQGYEQVGVTGISLGGSITMLLGCLEPAPDFIAPIISHLQLVDAVEEAPILWRMKRDLEKWGIDRDKRRDLFERLRLASYSPVLGRDRQLWIQAEEDAYIDAALARRQWEQWGRPEILWIPGGHMTFPLHVDAITRRIEEFRAGLVR